jgi:hypothetical protein
MSENVIPGNHGKVFGTNAKRIEDLKRIKSKILAVEGVKEVLIDEEKFPVELIVHTIDLVKVKDIEDTVAATGFHAIPKGLFEL